jgi:hypothetical protein
MATNATIGEQMHDARAVGTSPCMGATSERTGSPEYQRNASDEEHDERPRFGRDGF